MHSFKLTHIVTESFYKSMLDIVYHSLYKRPVIDKHSSNLLKMVKLLEVRCKSLLKLAEPDNVFHMIFDSYHDISTRF